MGAQILRGNVTFQGTRACQGLLVVDILNVVHERAALMQLHAVNFFAKVLECSQSTVIYCECVVCAVAKQKKSKLPSTRVGAKFDHQSPSADNWLPSFGRVWSKNCRTHNQYVM